MRTHQPEKPVVTHMRIPKANPNQPLIQFGYRQPRKNPMDALPKPETRTSSHSRSSDVAKQFRDNQAAARRSSDVQPGTGRKILGWGLAALVLYFVIAGPPKGSPQPTAGTVPTTISLAQACSAIGGAIQASQTGQRYEPPRVVYPSKYADVVLFKNITTSFVDGSHQHVVERACGKNGGSYRVVNHLNNGGVVAFSFWVTQYADGTIAVSGARQLPTLGANVSAVYSISDLHG